MSDPVDKISLWTEGLDEGWSMDSDQVDRMDRGAQSIKDIIEHVEMLIFRYGDELDCMLVLRHKEKFVHLSLSNKLIEASDPNDQTYQNIPVEQEKLYQFLEEFIYEEPEPEEDELQIRYDKKGIIAMLGAVVVLVLAIYFSGFYSSSEEGFMPVPSAVEFNDPIEIQNFYQRNAGLYATAIDDGEMLIELSSDGKWGFYDLTKRSSRLFVGTTISEGEYVPGKEGNLTAIVTDKRFVFYPKTGGELEFLQRPFTRIAGSREEVAYLDLPEIH